MVVSRSKRVNCPPRTTSYTQRANTLLGGFPMSRAPGPAAGVEGESRTTVMPALVAQGTAIGSREVGVVVAIVTVMMVASPPTRLVVVLGKMQVQAQVQVWMGRTV